ncbi:hybrid sensor histidine kinase/response regulator [Sphingomonas sp. CFBP 13720]|uniref:hybrid sensor histidine kinase/response regulator n=1 Tax=Sphingomonas sp. CFBP 13720 TaxID=2775302 RepID=UPI0020180466|nr:PAS-domain containing protein [Sphingomonas sp. CFBP 13720]
MAYAVLLFLVAHRVDGVGSDGVRRRWRQAAYALSLTVYCTSWTFYGAVGSASIGGWSYLPIYVGPILLYALGIRWLERLIVVAKHVGATSVSDLIGARFGKSRGVAALVTLLALAGTVPYLALQLRSVGATYALLSGHASLPAMAATAVVLALFAMLFGTRRYEATGHSPGVLFAVALESVVKMVAFVAIGLFAVLTIVDAPPVARGEALDRLGGLFTPTSLTADFVVTTLLAGAAAICLPRQFYVAVTQAEDAGDIRRARWPFAGYLAIFSLLVVPITLAGLTLAPGGAADVLVITLPLQAGNRALALLVFIGGFSAATGMVIVEMIALSTMVSNDLVAPLLIRRLASVSEADVGTVLLRVRRTVIVVLMAVALGYAAAMPVGVTLAGTGLVAFAAMAQFAPALIMAVGSDQRDAPAAKAGLATGFAMWTFLVLVPALGGGTPLHGVADRIGMGTIAVGAVASLAANLFVHALMAARQVRVGRIGFLPHPARSARPSMTQGELVDFVARFVGAEKARAALATDDADGADGADGVPRARARTAERLVASVVGAPSARVLVASALSGASLSARDVAQMLDESGQSLQFSQGLLAATLENIDPAVSVVDRDLTLVAWNTRYLEMFDFPPGMIRVGAPVADAIAFNALRGECGPGEIDGHVARRLANIRRGQPHSFERTRSDGRILKTIGGPMPRGGYVMCFSDVTAEAQARKLLETARIDLEARVAQRTAELSAVNADLARATADKTRFLAAASHDLIQPLHAARLFTAALDRELGGHPLAAKVDQSIVAAERLLRALLDISRLDAGGITPVVKPFALRPMLRDLIDGFDEQASDRGLRLGLAPGDAIVASDATMVRSIVQNLVSNAIRYTARGGVLVGIRRRGAAVVIEVWDTGVGIPPEDRQRIFGEFERLDSGNDVGIGLGLAIVERTARLLDAELTLTSTVGRGSRFALTLPSAEMAPPVVARPTARPVSPAAGVRILIVDDDARVRDAMATMLRARGHGVIVAKDPAGAMAAEPYDVALVDFHLGDADGLALIAALPPCPAALVTADPDPALARRAAAQGVALLAKPLDPSALDAWLGVVVGG